MTEQEWLTSTNPSLLLAFLKREWATCGEGHPGRGAWGHRKLQLVACGLMRQWWDVLPSPLGRQAIELAERHADSEATIEELACMARELSRICLLNLEDAGERLPGIPEGARFPPCPGCGPAELLRPLRQSADAVCWMLHEGEGADRGRQAVLIRDVFSTPFLPCPMILEGRMTVGKEERPAITVTRQMLLWEGGKVPSIARRIYAERCYEAMPVLADALEEAGCTNADILEHCRSGQEHARGCWVLDLLTGKE